MDLAHGYSVVTGSYMYTYHIFSPIKGKPRLYVSAIRLRIFMEIDWNVLHFDNISQASLQQAICNNLR